MKQLFMRVIKGLHNTNQASTNKERDIMYKFFDDFFRFINELKMSLGLVFLIKKMILG